MIAMITILGWLVCLAVAVGIASQELEIKAAIWRFRWRLRNGRDKEMRASK